MSHQKYPKQRLKHSFFSHQIALMSGLHDNLQAMNDKHLKKYLGDQQTIITNENCRNLHKIIINLRDKIKESILRTRLASNIEIYQDKIEEENYFISYGVKIGDLNQMLVQTQGNVQRAENIKKEIQRSGAEYQPCGHKTYKKILQTKTINKYLQAKLRITKQLIRNMKLLEKIKDIKAKQSKFQCRLTQFANMKKKGISYTQFREYNANKALKLDKSQSVTKYSQSSSLLQQYPCLSRFQSKPPSYIKILIKSPKMSDYYKQALKIYIRSLKYQNQQNTITNKYLTQSAVLHNKNKVLRYLNSNDCAELNYEECLMKIELLAEITNRNIQERMLGLFRKGEQKVRSNYGRNISAQKIKNHLKPRKLSLEIIKNTKQSNFKTLLNGHMPEIKYNEEL